MRRLRSRGVGRGWSALLSPTDAGQAHVSVPCVRGPREGRMDPIARSRQEAKYLIERSRADALLAAVAERLGKPDAPATMVRSVYFDAPDKGFAAQAIAAPD